MDRNNKMGKIVTDYILIAMIFSLQGCIGEEPIREEIIGVWKASDGGILQLKDDGTFTTKDLSGNIIFKYSNKHKENAFTESGNWKIEKWQGQWVVSLRFTKSENLKKGYATRVLISGTGILENNPPLNLFLWVGEEGGERYTFKKE